MFDLVPRHLEDPGFIRIIPKVGEDIPEVVPDDILQQDDVVLVHRGGRQDDKTAQYPAGYLDQRIFTFHAAIPAGEDDTEVQRLIPR